MTVDCLTVDCLTVDCLTDKSFIAGFVTAECMTMQKFHCMAAQRMVVECMTVQKNLFGGATEAYGWKSWGECGTNRASVKFRG